MATAAPVVLGLASMLVGQYDGSGNVRRYRRADPPRWEKVPEGVFFEDAFREALSGPLPLSRGPGGPDAATEPADASPSARHDWATIVSFQTLEDEIKRLAIRIQAHVANVNSFAAGGFHEYQRDMWLVATLFRVIAEYPGAVRWHGEAHDAAARFAAAAQRGGSGDRQRYSQAAQDAAQLNDLLRGQPWQRQPGGPLVNWPDVADRQAIMQRLELAEQTNIGPALQSAAEFRRRHDALRHEAELVHLWGTILAFSEMPDGSDDEYTSYCRQLSGAAVALRRAVQDGDHPAAREAFGQLRRACTDCHQAYRVQ